MSSRSGRDDAGAGGARRPREPPEQELQRRREQKRRRHDAQQLQQLKHLESFYEKPPPGLIKEDETKPEDCIPDVPGNEHAREFLAHAPTKGLWMPLGKEVKVMQLTGRTTQNVSSGYPWVAHEDPMYDIIRENKRHEKDIRIQQLKQLLEDSTSDEDESSSSSSEGKEKNKKKKKKEKHKKKKKEKKRKKKRKHKSSKSNESSDSD
uniref:RP9 pre-mRNA splicing factor n=1 Tax=Equus caballus TaxID=9796 RepID=A0A9L0S9Y8_HORSE